MNKLNDYVFKVNLSPELKIMYCKWAAIWVKIVYNRNEAVA
jgi:hypothetical protein